MNPDALLTRLRLEQRYLIDIDKKLHELEYLLPGADPVQFLDAAKRTALLSERSTAQLRSFLFTIYGGMPQDYYLQAAEMQGIRIDVTDGILSVRLPALLPKKTHTEGFKFLQSSLHAALKQYAEQQNLPHFRECTVCIEHVYDHCLPIKAVRNYDNLEMKEVLDIIALYCMTDDTGALCDQFQTTRFADSSCTIISVMQKEKFSAWLDMKNPATSVKIDLHFVRKIFQKSLLAHFGGLSASQSPFRHSKRKSCTVDNVLTVGKRGDSYFFTVSSFTVP